MANMDASPTYQSVLQAQRALGGNDAEEFLDHVLAQLCLLADGSSTVTPASITTALANTKSSIKSRKRNY